MPNTDQSVPVTDPVPPGSVEEVTTDMVEGADEWLDATAAAFDPTRGPGPAKRTVRRKAFTEAGIYADITHASGDDVPASLWEQVVSAGNDPACYRLLLRNPDMFAGLGYPLVALDIRDRLSADASEVIDSVVDHPAARLSGYTASRQLDYWHTCRVYGHDPPGVDHQTLLDYGYTAGCANPLYADQQELYGVTHEILFFHNFGSRRSRFPDGRVDYDYPAVFTGAMLQYMSEGHVDLVAELLFVAVLQRQVPPGFVRFTLGWIREHVTDDGALRFPSDDLAELEQFLGPDVSEWSGDQQLWRRRYHPTIILGLMARTVRDSWNRLVSECERRTFDYEASGDRLFELGAALDALASYSLERGTELLEELTGTGVVRAYGDVADHAVRFLRDQRHNGTYGAWVDERRRFTASAEDRTTERFERELVEPLAERCDETVDTVGTVVEESSEAAHRETRHDTESEQ